MLLRIIVVTTDLNSYRDEEFRMSSVPLSPNFNNRIYPTWGLLFRSGAGEFKSFFKNLILRK